MENRYYSDSLDPGKEQVQSNSIITVQLGAVRLVL